MRILSVLCGLLVAFTTAVPAAPAFAQATPPPAAAVSDAKLHAFIVAAVKVGDLIDKWSPKIEAAATTEEKKLKQQANNELVSAIQGSGDMTLPEYRQISPAAETDPALQERIIKLLQEGGPQKQ